MFRTTFKLTITRKTFRKHFATFHKAMFKKCRFFNFFAKRCGILRMAGDSPAQKKPGLILDATMSEKSDTGKSWTQSFKKICRRKKIGRMYQGEVCVTLLKPGFFGACRSGPKLPAYQPHYTHFLYIFLVCQ